jgi:hypothetical protein
MINPFVNSITGIGQLEKRQPFKAGIGDIVKAIEVLFMLKTKRHGLNIQLNYNPRLSLPFAQAHRRKPRPDVEAQLQDIFKYP